MKKMILMTLFLSCVVLAGMTQAGSDENNDPLLTREGMEKKLGSFGIQPYPQAVFNNVSFKRNNYSIVYDILPATQENKDAVDAYYNDVLKKMEDNGWKRLTISAGMFIMSKEKDSVTWAHGYNAQAKLNRVSISYSAK